MQESGEMYLQYIYLLSKEKPRVRSIDLSEHMGYSKPSISRAVSILKKDGYITVDEHGGLNLTPPGLAIAEKIYERHVLLEKFLVHIGVSSEVAAHDACRMEHVISDETFHSLRAYVNTLSKDSH